MQQINIDISPAGNVKIDACGFSGQGCVKATEQIEIVLGGQGKKRDKPEMYQPPISTEQHAQLKF